MPSQQFAFDLVEEAMSKGKIIILMRSRKLWFNAISDLEGYEQLMILHSPQNVIISPKNLGEDNFKIVTERLIGNKETS